jgi:hypothetical protein
VRHRAYLNWRYADPRAGRYTIRVAEEKGELLGYVVPAVSRGKGFIADLLVLPGRLDVVAALVEDAAGHLAERGLSALRCWCAKRHPYRRCCCAVVQAVAARRRLPLWPTEGPRVADEG